MLLRVRNGRMTDDELQAIVSQRMGLSSVAMSAGVSTQGERSKALQYYRGEEVGVLERVPGRSGVVSRDVQETVDGLMPSLLKVFASGPPVEMRAKRAGTDRAAEQATELCQYVWNVQNDGFLVYSTWFKDALLQRLGTVKIWWDDTEQTEKRIFRGLSEVERKILEQEPSIQVTSVEKVKNEQFPGLDFYDVETQVVRMPGKVCVDCIPPENFIYDYYATSLDKARIVGDASEYTVSELVDMGYDRRLIEDIPPGSYVNWSQDRVARFNDSRAVGFGSADESDPASEPRWVYELYLRVDYDGDGRAEMRKVVCAGPNAPILLENEEVEDHPYACLTPTIMPHRIEGLSVADMTMDIQDVKSHLVRGLLDGTYLSIRPRSAVLEGQVNIEDALNVRPGGVVRVKSIGAITPLPTNFDPSAAQSMVAYMDKVRELRTGLPQSPGELSDDVIAQDGGATGANIINDARMERVELIARTFAETGVKDAFRKVLKLVKAYQTQPIQMQMGGQWQQIDPSQWDEGFDIEIKVGLGSGKKDQMLMHLLPIKQTQEQILMQFGPENPIVGLEQYHNTLQDLVKNAGLGDPSRYWKNPAEQPPWRPPPKQDPAMLKAQADAQLAQLKMQLQAAEAQQQMQIERERASNEMEIAQFKAQADIQLQREKTIAQAALTANQELAQMGMIGNAASDGIPPDEGEDFSGIENIISKGMDGLNQQIAGFMQPPEGGEIPMMPAEAEPEEPAEAMEPEEPEDSEDKVQTQVLTSLADILRQQSEETAAMQRQMTEAMTTMAQAIAKMSGPRTVRRGKDGKIEGVD